MTDRHHCILALDPSLIETGYAIIDGENHHVQHYGTIPTKQSHTMQRRLGDIGTAIADLITRYHPTDVALELPFVGQNRNTALTLGAVRGVVLYLAEQHHLPAHEYTTFQIKTAMTGVQTAGKAQVRAMVSRLTNAHPRNDNESDAIATGLTHVRHAKFLRALRTKKTCTSQ